MDTEKTIRERKSIKSFNPKKIIDWRTIIEIIDFARFAPMAGNNFSLKFILVQDKEKIQKLTEASQQPFISNASSILVVCTVPSRTKNLYEERAGKYLQQQAGAAIQNILLAATNKKVGTCWIGHFVEEQVKNILKIPGNIEAEAMIAFGTASPKDTRPKTKIALQNILYFDEYKNDQMRDKEKDRMTA